MAYDETNRENRHDEAGPFFRANTIDEESPYHSEHSRCERAKGKPMNEIRKIEAKQMKEELPRFLAGDTVRVHFKIVEGANERVQAFEGTCIAKKNAGLRSTFTVRKISYGVGVERVFPIHSPRVQRVEVVRRGRARRSKLYYLRDRVGKSAKIRERLVRKEKPAAVDAQ